MTRLILAAILLLSMASPALAQPIEPGRRHSIASAVLGENRSVVVRLPPAYEGASRRFPVLYLTDGDAQFLHTVATVDFLARNGRMPDLIVVGISNTDRTRDLTPTRVTGNPYGGNPQALRTSGGADKFLAFIETELAPWVERQFRTEPFRLFAGHSFGGLFALHAFFSRPSLFNGVIAVSPTLTWDKDLPLRRAREYVAKAQERPRALVVTVGNEGKELDRAFDELKRIVAGGAGTHAAFERYPEDDHSSLVLASHHFGLRAIFAGWQLPRDAETGAFTGGIDAVEQHYARLSQRLGWKVQPPEAVVNLLGYQAIAGGRVADALKLFERNLAAYPESANVYDSYGEGLEAAGRLADALKQYERAVELGEQSSDANLAVFKEHRDAARKKAGS